MVERIAILRGRDLGRGDRESGIEPGQTGGLGRKIGCGFADDEVEAGLSTDVDHGYWANRR